MNKIKDIYIIAAITSIIAFGSFGSFLYLIIVLNNGFKLDDSISMVLGKTDKLNREIFQLENSIMSSCYKGRK